MYHKKSKQEYIFLLKWIVYIRRRIINSLHGTREENPEWIGGGVLKTIETLHRMDQIRTR